MGIEGVFPEAPQAPEQRPDHALLAMANMLPRQEMLHYQGEFNGREYYDAFTESSESDDEDDLRKMFPEFFDIYDF